MLRRIWVSSDNLIDVDFTVAECGGFVPSNAINDRIAAAGLAPTAAMIEDFNQNCAELGLCELVTLQ